MAACPGADEYPIHPTAPDHRFLDAGASPIESMSEVLEAAGVFVVAEDFAEGRSAQVFCLDKAA